MMTKEVLRLLDEVEERRNRFKNAYFMSGRYYGNSKDRENYCKKLRIPEFGWDEGGHHYTAYFGITMSAQNIYPVFRYTKDGVKTTYTTIKNSQKRLQKEVEA